MVLLLVPMPDPASPISEAHARVRRVRGYGVPLLRATWRATLQDAEWETLRQDVDDQARAFLDAPPDADTWVDCDLLYRAVQAYHRIKPLELSRLQGALAAEAFMAQAPAAFPSPQELLDQTPFLWRHNFEGGLAQVVRRGPKDAEISIWAILPFGPWMADLLPAWYQKVLDASGSAEAQVEYTPPGEGTYLHRYRLRW